MRMCKKGSAEFKSILYLYIFNFQIYCLFPALHFNCLHAHQNGGGGGLHVSSLFYIVNLKKNVCCGKKWGGGSYSCHLPETL